MKRAIPDEAYGCTICRSRCHCHGVPHADCPTQEVRDCEGGCGRRTTAGESCHAGFWCRSCAHESGNVGAWRVRALVETRDGWRWHVSSASSYTDALALGWKLEGIGARKVRLVESSGTRPRNRARMRPPATSRAQLDMFGAKGKEALPMIPPRAALHLSDLHADERASERARRERLLRRHPPRPHVSPCDCEQCRRWAQAVMASVTPTGDGT